MAGPEPVGFRIPGPQRISAADPTIPADGSHTDPNGLLETGCRLGCNEQSTHGLLKHTRSIILIVSPDLDTDVLEKLCVYISAMCTYFKYQLTQRIEASHFPRVGRLTPSKPS